MTTCSCDCLSDVNRESKESQLGVLVRERGKDVSVNVCRRVYVSANGRDKESRMVSLTIETKGIDDIISSSAPRFSNRPMFLTESDRLKGRYERSHFCPTLSEENSQGLPLPMCYATSYGWAPSGYLFLFSWKKEGERACVRVRERRIDFFPFPFPWTWNLVHLCWIKEKERALQSLFVLLSFQKWSLCSCRSKMTAKWKEGKILMVRRISFVTLSSLLQYPFYFFSCLCLLFLSVFWCFFGSVSLKKTMVDPWTTTRDREKRKETGKSEEGERRDGTEKYFNMRLAEGEDGSESMGFCLPDRLFVAWLLWDMMDTQSIKGLYSSNDPSFPFPIPLLSLPPQCPSAPFFVYLFFCLLNLSIVFVFSWSLFVHKHIRTWEGGALHPQKSARLWSTKWGRSNNKRRRRITFYSYSLYHNDRHWVKAIMPFLLLSTQHHRMTTPCEKRWFLLFVCFGRRCATSK